ncbi:S16 family serine protease [Ursidibacter arcticus]
MQFSPIKWQSLNIEYSFSDKYSPISFFDFQKNAQNAIQQFGLSDKGACLILKTETLPEFLTEINSFLAKQHIQATIKNEFNRNSLFGYYFYLEKENRIENVEGILQTLENGVLLLNINMLLLDLTQWDKLKQALLFKHYEPCMVNAVPKAQPTVQAEFKLILMGSRDDIATLYAYDDSLYQFCQYAEIESYLTVSEPIQIEQWGNYVQTFTQKLLNKRFSHKALNQLLRHYIRESENQKLISISPTLLKKHILAIATFYPNQNEFADIQDYLTTLEQQSAVLNQYVLQDILDNQLYIETEDDVVGQINALSVVEFDGVPYAFGEPLRISCNIQYGDGEIQDIERKVELGGNIHSKGIMIAESCLANLLEFPTQLPFSASLAFEQSYGEVDGDSSSLAIFCVLISALAKLPLPQSLAVTGAIDQFGNVLSVGGVNQKIEGFFNICQARELTGKQGVIIPSVCLSHLSLKPEVLSAIKEQRFHIWTVENVSEAIQILLQHAFYDEDLPEDSEQSSIYALVHQQIENNQSEGTSGSILQKLCKVFFKAR